MTYSRQITSYEQALEYLYERVNFERVDAGSYSVSEFKLDRMQKLLALLGNPQDSIPVVHIAGTKGKGSTACMVASILRASGYRTGLMTSPHLLAFEERFTVDGVQPDQADVVRLVSRVALMVDSLESERVFGGVTFFEITTALAWMSFAENHIDVAVLEVGLGGRLDATNICRPAVSVITTISRDHMQQLGHELPSIAREKAGIIKPSVPVICGVEGGDARDVIEQVAQEKNSPYQILGRDFRWKSIGVQGPHGEPNQLIEVDLGPRTISPVRVPLMGWHQAHNTTLALAAVQVLIQQGWNIDEPSIHQGLERVCWPARMEIVNKHPVVVLDSAHNWASGQALVRTLMENFQSRSRTLIFSASRDKDVRGMLRTMIPFFETVILTRAQQSVRSMSVEELALIARSVSGRSMHLVDDPQQAWRIAYRWAEKDDLICIAGSIFIAAELREVLLEEFSESRPSASDRIDNSPGIGQK